MALGRFSRSAPRKEVSVVNRLDQYPIIKTDKTSLSSGVGERLTSPANSIYLDQQLDITGWAGCTYDIEPWTLRAALCLWAIT